MRDLHGMFNRRETIFYNENILINQKYVVAEFLSWYQKVVLLLHDLDEYGEFLDSDVLKSLYAIKVAF